MDFKQIQLKKGHQISPAKIQSIYKHFKLEESNWNETVEEINTFLLTNDGFWNILLENKESSSEPQTIYTIIFTQSGSGTLSYTII